MWYLVIILMGHSVDHIEMFNERTCETAKVKIERESKEWGSMKPVMICIQK